MNKKYNFYAEGGSLGNHGLKEGDQILKTMSGGVQKVKTKTGDIVYVNLANGYRGAEPPLPFDNGGEVSNSNITKAKRTNVKKWYTKTYPKDDLGQEIRESINFWSLWSLMSQGYDIYNILGVGDSMIRERVFEKLSEILEIDYNVIYQKWLNSDDYAKGGGVRKVGNREYSTGRNWTNDHRHVNKSEQHEVNYNRRNSLFFAGGGEIRRFDRQAQMDSETREEILDVLSESDTPKVLTNYLYGLFDGYDYSETANFKKEVEFLKRKNPKLHQRVVDIYKKIDKYKFEKYQDNYATGGGVDNNITYELENFNINDLDEFETMQYNQFYPSLGKVGALQVLINNVEGDYSQLSEELSELAEKQMSSEDWDEGTREMMFERDGYATGGVTKNYINRNQLNTITIKKGDQKLTYKVSDVYNGAYKLEDGGNLEKTAFYVPKRNVVKVQLRDGKDVKVANGYWIKKGAKPIRASKFEDGGQLEIKFAGGGKLETKIQKKVDEVNSLIEKAIDKDGDPLMVVDTTGTWEEPMQYKPIVYKNGRLYIEYFEPYSGKTEKDVINKSNVDFDGYPTLLNIAKMYRKALKEKGISFSHGGNLNYGIPKEDLQNYKIVEVLKVVADINYDSSDLEKSKFVILAKPINNNYKNNFYEPKVFIITGKSIYTIDNVKNSKWEDIEKDSFDNNLTYERHGYFKIMLSGGKTTFKQKATAIAKNFEGKKVEPKYQKEYGKTYDKAEAKEVGNKIAGSMKAKYDSKMSGGGKTKRGGAMVLAKQIRKEGESWSSALKRANEQMKNK